MKKIYLYAGMNLLLVVCSADTMTNEVTKTQYLEQIQRTDSPLVLIKTIVRGMCE